MPTISPLTSIQAILYSRTAGLLRFVYPQTITAQNPSPTPIDPASPATTIYSDPIGWAASNLGITLADPFAPADGDFAKLAATQAYTLIDLAELRLLASTMNSYTDTDETSLDISQSWNAMATRFSSRVAALEKMYAPLIKSGQSVVSFGRVGLGFQSRGVRGFRGGEFGSY